MRTNVRRLLICGVCLTGLASAAAHAAEPRLEWSFKTEGKIYASPIIADLDGDGRPEVVVCASRDRRVLCLDGDGELLWGFRIEDGDPDGLHATPSVADYDGDGLKEVFFASHAGTLGCLDCQGLLIWRTFLADKVDYSGPVLADINNDGRLEVVTGSDSGTVYCIDDCGAIIWRYKGEGAVRGLPAVARDHKTDVTRVFAVFGEGAEVCLSGKGELIWSHTEPTQRGERRSGPAIGDVDNDGAFEVITATDRFDVIVRDAWTGAEEWRWAGNAACDQTNSFALGVLDKWNRLDIICADGTGQGGTGHVHRLRDGEALWSVDVGGAVVQGPSIADVDGDGEPEILVCSRSKRIVCLSAADGAEEWSFPSDTEVLTTPAIGDIDGDGKVEIVFTSKDHFVYCLTVDGTYNPRHMIWPMLNHDPQLSGNAWGAPFAPPALATRTQVPAVMIREFEPVRAGNNRFFVDVVNNFYRPRHLEATVAVWPPNHRLVNRIVTRRFEPLEKQVIEIEFPALFEGPYAVGASLCDVNPGTTLFEEEQSAELDLDADLDMEVRRMLLGGPELMGFLRPGPAQWRIERAYAHVTERHDAALSHMRDVIRGAEASIEERRASVDAVRTVLAQMNRILARAHALKLTPSPSAEFGVVACPTLKKVFKDEAFLTPYVAGRPEIKPAAISLCRNEREGVQIVVVPILKDLKNLRVSIAGDLVKDGAAIPADNVEIHRVGYVTIGPPEYAYIVEKQGEYPDILFPNAAIDVAAAQDAQPFFVTVKADDGTPPGDYAGAIRVEADGCPPISIAFNVHVWDFAIPPKPKMPVSIWMSEASIKSFYKYEDRTPREVRERFYQFHLDHRVSPIKDFPIGGGAMVEDFEYLMGHGQNVFFVPLPGRLEEEERPAFAQRLSDTRALLQEKGWDDKALFYSLDEVAVVQRHMIPHMVAVNDWVKGVLPEWPRLETSAPEQALFGAVDIWCPTIDSFDPRVLKHRMGQGDRLWFYTVWGRPGIMIEFPATDYRLMFWTCAKYNAEGFLYWGSTHWGLNCEGDERWPAKPWITYNRQPGHNGCGYLIYPGPDGTPIASIRFALVRDGIEDFEYITLLRDLIETVGDKVSQELKYQAMADAHVPAEIMVDHKKYTEDPEMILAVRARIAGLIEEFGKLAKE